jgi:hypothetical protein
MKKKVSRKEEKFKKKAQRRSLGFLCGLIFLPLRLCVKPVSSNASDTDS